MTVAQVEEALLALDRRDRAAVIHRGLQTLDVQAEETPQEEVEATWGAELRRRIDDIESGRVQMLTHDELFGRARAAVAALHQ